MFLRWPVLGPNYFGAVPVWPTVFAALIAVHKGQPALLVGLAAAVGPTAGKAIRFVAVMMVPGLL